MSRLIGSLVQFLAAIIGACGVAFAAYASHATVHQSVAVPAAAILLTHAPALLALSLVAIGGRRTTGFIGIAMALGVVIFAGDLAARIWLGGRLFPGAAPFGGGLIILSWLALAIDAVIRPFFDIRRSVDGGVRGGK